ncbi:MAG TPA: hypothetical protein VFC19_00575 [Candidatus Limnocylindrales bacterium]|nr:hypothetical protein [Candidatus Limnocylindrales bacterium]
MRTAYAQLNSGWGWPTFQKVKVTVCEPLLQTGRPVVHSRAVTMAATSIDISMTAPRLAAMSIACVPSVGLWNPNSFLC